MSQLFRDISSLLFSQQLQAKPAINLVLERLYYADGRHNPNHPPARQLRWIDRPATTLRTIGINHYVHGVRHS